MVRAAPLEAIVAYVAVVEGGWETGGGDVYSRCRFQLLVCEGDGGEVDAARRLLVGVLLVIDPVSAMTISCVVRSSLGSPLLPIGGSSVSAAPPELRGFLSMIICFVSRLSSNYKIGIKSS